MSASQDNQILVALQNGDFEIQGEFIWGSNYTFSVLVRYGDTCVQAVYKPTRGERPLWDFPVASLARREVAAYLVSETLGWKLVPPTVYCHRAPMGPGSVQQYIEHDPEYHYFNFKEADRQRLRPVALFDLLVNNADRKGSHVIIDANNHLWLIDHGICFHREDKLRTVIWDFAGEPIPENLIAGLNRLKSWMTPPSRLIDDLKDYLNPQEIASLARRNNQLLASRRFPNPQLNRRPYPWPPI